MSLLDCYGKHTHAMLARQRLRFFLIGYNDYLCD
jgi:hypothetical protein